MALVNEISGALLAHGRWRARLKRAIDEGRLDAPPSLIRADDACDFGSWLYGPSVSPEARAHEGYERCRQLHAEFHAAAAEVAELVLAGRQKEAQRLVEQGGRYAQASAALVLAMIDWMNNCG